MQLTKNNGSRTLPLRAMVISADSADQGTLKGLLNECGVEPVFLSTLRETIGRLGRDGSRLLLCQASLPDGTFRDVIRAIAEMGLNVPVIVCSDFYDKDLYIEAMAMGAFDYLAFPYRDEEVAWVINNAVNSSSDSIAEHSEVRF